MAPAIIETLELLAASKESTLSPNGTNENTQDTNKDTDEMMAQLVDKNKTIGDKEKVIGDLEAVLKFKSIL